MGDTNAVTTRLLTLLNVSGTKIGKGKSPYEDDDTPPGENLNKRRSIRFSDSENHSDSPVVTEVAVEETKGKVPKTWRMKRMISRMPAIGQQFHILDRY